MKKTRKFLITILLALSAIFALFGFSGCYFKDLITGQIVKKGGITYKKSKTGNSWMIIDCNENKTEVVIASDINGMPITSIFPFAFSYCVSLTSVEIPDSVTTIGERAFYRCGSLTSVKIPDSVTMIGVDAFYRCVSLTSVEIGDSVTTIGDEAFSYCGSLTSVEIGDSVTTIGDEAFSYCKSLEAVYIENIKAWCNIEFNNSLANPLYYAENLYVNNQLVTDLVIPNTVTKINEHTFRGCHSLVSVTIPNSVTSIGAFAFYDCENLTSVILSNAITYMGKDIFTFCENLHYNEYGNGYYLGNTTQKYLMLMNVANSDITKIEILPETKYIFQSTFSDCALLKNVYITDLEAWCNITFSDHLSNPLSNGANLYLNDEMVTNLVIPDSVSIIKEFAFFNCKSLMNVTIPKSVSYIDNRAFYGCQKLISVVISDNVDTIYYGAFGGCTSLEDITLPFVGYKSTETEEARWNVFGYIFGDKTFDDKMDWTSASYTTSDASDFTSQVYNTKAEKYYSYTIPKSLKSVTITSAKTIPDYAFQNCDLLESIYLPISVESIGESAFVNCSKATIYCERKIKPNNWSSDWNYISSSKLAPVVWNSSQEHGTTNDGFQFVKLIGGQLCITGYEGTLSDIIIPETINGCKVTNIFERAFFDCDNLTSVTLPNSIDSIGNRAFYDCDNLYSIKIPKSVLSAEDFIFNSCKKLTIYCEAASQPNGWASNWNSSNCPVVWGYKEEN